MAKKSILTGKVEIKFGKITYLEPDKGAFVELITDSTKQAQEKTELFVPKELLAGKGTLAKDHLVQLKKDGDTVIEIKPF